MLNMTRAAALVVTVLFAVPVLAQGPAGGQGGARRGGGPGGPGGPGGFGQGGQRRGGRVSLANVPVEMLAPALNLSGEQKTKIKGIQDKLRADMRAAFSGFQGGGAGGADRDAIRAQLQKLGESNEKAGKDIEALLKPEQKTKVPEVLKEAGQLRAAGIPLEAVPELKLTADQKKKIVALGEENSTKMRAMFTPGQPPAADMREKMQAMRTEMRGKVSALLNADQKKVMEKYQQRGGFGGFGGGRPGGGPGGAGRPGGRPGAPGAPGAPKP